MQWERISVSRLEKYAGCTWQMYNFDTFNTCHFNYPEFTVADIYGLSSFMKKLQVLWVLPSNSAISMNLKFPFVFSTELLHSSIRQ
jgi:hypothetical protein